MNRKSIIAVTLVAVIALIGVLVHRVAFAKETPAYRLIAIERGSLEQTVSATGTLSAVKTVAVGTQVSGQVRDLLVDFNDTVKKGQLLARIDPTLAQQAVTDAQANLERAQAQLVQAQRENNRNGALLDAGLVARATYEQTDSSADVARANVKSAQVALQRARQNLEYTNIYSPIDGVIVERNVDLGQTVAASLSAPQLFMIANDLTDMQILAKVGESDIASIKEGQKTKFTVQALQGQTFEGTVQQVRLQSATTENVVNYTVVVSVNNAQKKLLPGMTARVSFLTSEADNVLKVANAALRFKPAADAKVAAPATTTAQTGTGAPSDAQRAAWRAGRGNGGVGNGQRTRSGGTGTLYVLDAKGTLTALKVRTGLTDGTSTEVRGRDLKEGMKVVAGTQQPQTAGKSASASPFQNGSSQQQRGPRPGGF